MAWSERLCQFLNNAFSKPPNPGGRESERAYQEVQFRNAAAVLHFYQQFVNFSDKMVLDLGCGLGGKTVYYALYSGARSVLGVDISADCIRAAIAFADLHGVTDTTRFQVIPSTLSELPANTFDLILSNDTLEHVDRPQQMMETCYKTLKPGGYACIDFGPLYYSYKGAHLYDYVYIPWCHLLFSQQTLINTTKHLPPQPHIFGHESTIARFTGLNKLTVRKFRAIVTQCHFDIVHWTIGRERSLKGVPVYGLSFLPLLGNLFMNSITCILQKK